VPHCLKAATGDEGGTKETGEAVVIDVLQEGEKAARREREEKRGREEPRRTWMPFLFP
jgi:hypothetical protein